MTPENRNSSVRRNGGKQVPEEMYFHAAIDKPVSKQRIGKHIKIGVFLEAGFSTPSVQSGYIESDKNWQSRLQLCEDK
jgi:hypothetical protein